MKIPYLRTCPKTGKILGFHFHSFGAKLLFPILGLAALIWFLVRVMPKPSRAGYPCIKIAAPVASSFVVWVTAILTSALAYHKARVHFINARILAGVAFVLAAVVIGIFSVAPTNKRVLANTMLQANQVYGEGKGLFPGRVVWSWNPEATNDNWVNKLGDAYYLPKNSDIDVIHNMVTESILTLTGTSSVKEAWESMFIYFNEQKGRGAVPYQAGEKIFIKINSVGSSVNSQYEIDKLSNYNMARTSPQPVLIVLRHLIHDCGIAQEHISVGDPMKDMSQPVFDVMAAEFPDVNYLCHKGGNKRTKSVVSAKTSIYYSDRGSVLREGSWTDASDGAKIYNDKFYTVVDEADYMINIPALKAHARAGVTLSAKSHFGSHTRSSAKHLHMGLPSPDMQTPYRTDYKMYRIQVDLLGHEKLGGNTMLVLVDGLWGGSEANDPPRKFFSAPFNNDWSSSIFVSQDAVAIESVCFDFLKAEYTEDNKWASWPQMGGADDYLRQAADPSQWPDGLMYDPEKDGTPLTSLGVHEHWNNADEKLYSKNLGTSDGIELVKIGNAATAVENNKMTVQAFSLYQNYPNPFNPSTTIQYKLVEPAQVKLSIYNVTGQLVQEIVDEFQTSGSFQYVWQAGDFPAAPYIYQLVVDGKGGYRVENKRMTLLK